MNANDERKNVRMAHENASDRNEQFDVVLDVEVLEVRIAPFSNRCETLEDHCEELEPVSKDQAWSTELGQLDVEVLEEQITPGLQRCETFVGEVKEHVQASDNQESAAQSQPQLDVDLLEERIAPFSTNRCETLVKQVNEQGQASTQQASTEQSQLDLEVLEERITPFTNRCESLMDGANTSNEDPQEGREAEAEECAVQIGVEILEKRTAPLITLNRCETLNDEQEPEK